MTHPAAPAPADLPRDYLDSRAEFVVLTVETELRLLDAIQSLQCVQSMLDRMGEFGHEPTIVPLDPCHLSSLLKITLERMTPATQGVPLLRLLSTRKDLGAAR